MKAKFKLANPDEVQASLTVTMSLREWRLLMEKLPTDPPAWGFGLAIRRILEEADKHFTAEETGVPHDR